MPRANPVMSPNCRVSAIFLSDLEDRAVKRELRKVLGRIDFSRDVAAKMQL